MRDSLDEDLGRRNGDAWYTGMVESTSGTEV